MTLGYHSCAQAAGCGHLETLKWLRENLCPWNEVTCYMATRGGHLHTLAWAIENGCPWHGYEVFDAALSRGMTEIVAWLQDRHGITREEPDQ
jgi:hypothetical protein